MKRSVTEIVTIGAVTVASVVMGCRDGRGSTAVVQRRSAGGEAFRGPSGLSLSTVMETRTDESRQALEALRTAVEASEPAALSTVGITLARAEGAQELTGEPAPDERISAAQVVQRQVDDAVLLIQTSCGNVTLSAVHWNGGRWRPGERVALVEGMQPGRCGQTTVRAEAIALSSDVRREIVTALTSQDATGASVRGPLLSVYRLGAGGTLVPLLAEAPFGSVDDATGATTVGEYSVVESAPPPRMLYVSIRPGRPGPGGAPANQIVRRRYALRGDRLELVDETTEPLN